MPKELVVIFVDYENIRRGLWRHFQKRVPEDITIRQLMEAIKATAEDIGSLYEAHVFGDWTIRGLDAREIENVQHFRAQLVLRSDSKKDRTDPVMNFAIDDVYREKSEINNVMLCAGDSDYCEVVRRGTRLHKNIYICAVGPQTAPELLSLAKAFFPIEQRLGIKPIDVDELREAIAKLDPGELTRWAPLIRQLDKAEQIFPYVVRAHFIKKFLWPAMGYGDTFEQQAITLDLAEQIGIIQSDRVPHPDSGIPVRTIQLMRNNEMVRAVVASGALS